MKPRRQRRADARAKTKGATARIDPAIMLLLVSAQKKVAEGRQAQATITTILTDLQARGVLGPKDAINLKTGEIVRNPKGT